MFKQLYIFIVYNLNTQFCMQKLLKKKIKKSLIVYTMFKIIYQEKSFNIFQTLHILCHSRLLHTLKSMVVKIIRIINCCNKKYYFMNKFRHIIWCQKKRKYRGSTIYNLQQNSMKNCKQTISKDLYSFLLNSISELSNITKKKTKIIKLWKNACFNRSINTKRQKNKNCNIYYWET